MNDKLEEHGTVIRVEGDFALVKFRRDNECSRCGLCRSSHGGTAVMLCHNPLHAVMGDTVKVEIGSVQLLRGSAVIYLLPLLIMFIGYALGKRVSEDIGVCSSILALILTFVAIRWYSLRYGMPLTSEITEVIEPWRSYP
ncbi:MAG: SoxR reducing system RseC family protein [bacterium]|nr:SoxR reducing system RseC family protein [bacterium]MDD4558991.1 SoxR reducing system RseC family protein [bacterium]